VTQSTVDILMFPHLDLHMALNISDHLTIDLRQRVTDTASPNRLVLNPAASFATFQFFAPHKAVGQRLTDVPTVQTSTTGPPITQIVATKPGVYLFQASVVDPRPSSSLVGCVVGRLQVHKELKDWWFGQDSVTTALDPGAGGLAHTQVSIYALFDDDPVSGVDLVGDITAHGIVSLSPATDSVNTITVQPWDRVQGLAETTAGPATLTGSLNGQQKQVKVQVVDYGKTRPALVSRRQGKAGVAPVNERFNVLFLAEGFRDTPQDRDLFDKIVQRAVHDLFEFPRHEPYLMLADSFNVFSVFTPSNDARSGITMGSRVADTHGPGQSDISGLPIPIPFHSQHSAANAYNLQQLVETVGLPMYKEQRQNLPDLWAGQHLPVFDRTKANDPELLREWPAYQSVSSLQAVDTFFGMYVGNRWADGPDPNRVPTIRRAAAVPTNDTTDPNLPAFIGQLYDFYKAPAATSLRPDPRRHPPELVSHADVPIPNSLIMRYVGGLQYTQASNTFPVGAEWIPDDTTYKPSRGLVAIISYEGLRAGENLNKFTLTATTVGNESTIDFSYDNSLPPGNTPPPQGNPVLHRTPPAQPTADHPNGAVLFDHTVSTIAHEFGHSFNLGDEYEDFGSEQADPIEATGVADISFDNLAQIGALQTVPPPIPATRPIEPTKLKWYTLPLVLLSSRLLADSTVANGVLTVTVSPDDVPKWIDAQTNGARVSIQNLPRNADRHQLPLPVTGGQFLLGLSISTFDQTAGTLGLIGLGTGPVPTFKKGSVVYRPMADQANNPLFAVAPDTATFLTAPPPAGHRPINQDPDFRHPSRKDDVPLAAVPHQPHDAFRLIGAYEGGNHWSRGYYRPAGACKMRDTDGQVEHGAFCFVCKWLIVNAVNPSLHSTLSTLWYPVR
jgi:hypothetical protein